jgi:maltose alpha-D-glucosyltransferase/alpha-amylase
VDGEWTRVFEGRPKARLEAILREAIRSRRWFGGKARTIQLLQIFDSIVMERTEETEPTVVAMLRVEYTAGEPETYVWPIAFAPAAAAADLQAKFPKVPICRLQLGAEGEAGLLYDALWRSEFTSGLLEAMRRRRRFKGHTGGLSARGSKLLRHKIDDQTPLPSATLLKGEQSNNSLAFGDQFVFKLFRRVESGVNPDLEVGRFLTEETSFGHVPPVAGWLEYRVPHEEPLVLGILSGYVVNQGTAWQHTLEILKRYFEQAAIDHLDFADGDELHSGESLIDLAGREISHTATERLGVFRQSAELLGQRTAELHKALSSETTLADFIAEPFTQHYQRSLYQSMRKLTTQTLSLLKRRTASLSDSAQADAKRVLEHQADMDHCLHNILSRRIHALRTRTHGDYHLGQVLYTGNDFVIIDFEGEPARSLSERRMKRSPIRDVAGMIRSFHYATYTAYFQYVEQFPETREPLRRAARYWYLWASARFLSKYLETAHNAAYLPSSPDELKLLLNTLLLEKSIYELNYELNNRPDWVEVPLLGITELVEASQSALAGLRT